MHSIPVSVLNVKWYLLRDVLIQQLGSPHRAEMVLSAMRIQGWYGECYASASFLAGQAFRGEKCWDRCLAKLRRHGLVETHRRIRPNGQQGTNSIDFTLLWRHLARILGSLLNKGRTRLFKRVRLEKYLLFKFSVNYHYGEVAIYPLVL